MSWFPSLLRQCVTTTSILKPSIINIPLRKNIAITILLFIPLSLKANSPDSIPITEIETKSTSRHFPFIMGITAASFLADKPINSYFVSNRSSFLNSATKITDLAGDKYLIIPASVITYGVAGYIIRDEKLTNTSLNSIQALATTAITTEIVKQLAGRARPYTERGSHHYSPFPIKNDDFKSMPSGHAALAFAAFTPFAENYSKWIYLIPVSVAAGRVYQNQHWFSDVMVESTPTTSFS
ncbi:PAP2 superfamily protein [Alkalitalea saponilacus]|uniref:PAP2 superfamily protein n=2 Tax=Alkalitalea saponilacus TaxID=889453 RepID=A0A1T5HTM1_9BACT|nr:phosphatase PAP2 family protein [Alkalitalea saponilacus]SKC24037.1 PAP2 superfamily protein [Alkalitalea saponilacus]